MRRILVVIEDEKLRQRLQLSLRGSGFEAAGVASLAAAARVLAGAGYGAVMARAADDPRVLAGLVAALRNLRPDLSVVAVVDADAAPSVGLAALRAGAADYWVATDDADSAGFGVSRFAAGSLGFDGLPSQPTATSESNHSARLEPPVSCRGTS